MDQSGHSQQSYKVIQRTLCCLESEGNLQFALGNLLLANPRNLAGNSERLWEILRITLQKFEKNLEFGHFVLGSRFFDDPGFETVAFGKRMFGLWTHFYNHRHTLAGNLWNLCLWNLEQNPNLLQLWRLRAMVASGGQFLLWFLWYCSFGLSAAVPPLICCINLFQVSGPGSSRFEWTDFIRWPVGVSGKKMKMIQSTRSFPFFPLRS